MKKPASKKCMIVCGILCAVIFGICWICRGFFTSTPFALSYTLDGPSGVFPGNEGRVYLIDQGKKMVLLLDEQGSIFGTIRCGKDDEDAPYYASLVTESADGNIYVADVRYAGMGTRISQERIFCYDRNGRGGTILYTIDYPEPEQMPLQYGNILSMREEGEVLVLSVRTLDGIAVRRVSTRTGEVESWEYPLPGQYISDADVLSGTTLPVFTSRTGQLCAVEQDGRVRILKDEGRTSWMLSAGRDKVYYTDLATNSVLCYDLTTGTEQVVLQSEGIIYTVQAWGDHICATDYSGYYQLKDRQTEYLDKLTYSIPVIRFALWMLLFLDIILLVVLLYLVLFRPQHGKKRSETFQRMVIVLFVSLSVGGLVSYITISSMIKSEQQKAVEQLNLFDDILIQSINVDALEQVDSLADYRSDTYMQVKESLDKLTAMTYNSNNYYYYIIYVTDGKVIYSVMDYEDTLTARHPMYSYGVPGYTEVLTEGTAQEVVGEVSSYGSWSFVIKPVRNREGRPVASIEVGVNLDYLNNQNRALSLEILMTVLSAAVVLVMLIIEALLYLEHRDQCVERAKKMPTGHRFPLRTILFLTFLVDCMQDAFISILANQRYKPLLGIPQSVGAALPLSAQVLFTALFAFAGGFITRRTGVKRVLIVGFLMQISGFILCGLFPDYLSLLLGKCLIGAGMGLIIVSTNSVAAGSGSQEESGSAFAAISAGTLAGVTAGAGIGSIILSLGSFSVVYYTGAVLLLLAIPLILTGGEYREQPLKKTSEKVGIFRFLSDRRVLSFLLLALLPFLLALSYREYFFPLYAAEMGMSEAMIGRIYLICGLLIIYAGPALTEKLISHLGGKWTVALASLFMCLAPLLFVLSPTIWTAIAGIVLLSLSLSFGYAAQSTYYSGLPGVIRYGESRAMGVYSLFDNGGQTLGPVVYGIAMLGGYRMGLSVIGVALVVLLGLFLFFNRQKKS